MIKNIVVCAVFAFFSIIAACSGGGGGSTPGAPDTTPPAISSTTPSNNATDVALNSSVIAVFTEAVTGVDGTTFTLTDGLSNAVTGTVTYTGVTAVLTPASNLAGNTTYSASITTAVKDAAGNALAANYTWAFTTGSGIDTTPPSVDSTWPAADQVDVTIATMADVYFTEPIDCSTVSAATMTIHDGDNNGVDGSLSCDADLVRFTPSSLLAPFTAYTGTVTTGIRDSAGNAMAADYTWTFTTGDVLFGVMTVSPANSAAGVSQMTPLRVTFNRALDCSTVSNATFALVDSGSNPVTGAVACSGSQVTFTPAAGLSPGMAYTATIAPVRESGLIDWSAEQSWTFTTNAPAAMPVVFTGAITNRWVQAVGADAAGNVIMVYLREMDATHYVVSAQRYNKAAGAWGGHTNLATADVSFSMPVKLAVNKDGYAVAMWNAYGNDHTYYSYYNPSNSTWSSAAYVADAPGGSAVLSFEPAIDGNGNVMAVWSVYENGNHWSYARYYQRSNGTWNAVQNISAGDYPHNRDPRFAFDADGGGMAVSWKWRALWDGSAQIMISSLTYSAGTGTWSDLVDIEQDGQYPDIGIDASGNAVAVWVKHFNWDSTSYYYGVGAATRAAGDNWVVRDAGWDPKGNASNPRVLVAPGGNAMAVWNYSSGGLNNINAAYLTTYPFDWSPAGVDKSPQEYDHYLVWRVVSGQAPDRDANGAQFVIDGNGNTTLVYSQSDGTHSNVYSMIYTKPTGSVPGFWTPAAEIDSTDSDASGGVIAIDGTGKTMTVWNQPNPTINDFWFLLQ